MTNNCQNEKPSRPNVILILIDDMGWMDLTCQGSSFYETPNIDRLAAEGMRFTDAYAACPVCSPTRASIMSGKYPARIGLTNFIGGPEHCKLGGEKGRLLGAPYVPFLSTRETSLATALKHHGYATWHLGKWHLGSEAYWPENHGFDLNIGGCHMGHPRGRGHYFLPWDIPTLPEKPGDHYLTDRLGDEAVELIKNSDTTPFFMNMWFYSVHTPIQAKPEKIRKYEEKAKALGIDKRQAIVEGDYYPCEHKKTGRIQRRVLQSDPKYAAMIESLDENVGKILDALDKKGIAGNTIVVFTSDNGGLSTAEGSPTCNAPLVEGKGWMYEGGVREPLLVGWPGNVQADTTSDAVVTSPDFYPTFLEACGLPLMPEQHVDGKSFLSALTGEAFDRGAVFWHFPHYANQGGTPGCSIRKGDWKLIEFFEGEMELYDLAKDISEQHNLADRHPERVKELLAELHARHLKADALNLGLSGSCHCEKEMADYLAGRDDWDMISLELGVNMRGGFTPNEFQARSRYLIEQVIGKHPDKPVFLITIFPNGKSPQNALVPDEVQRNQEAFSQILREMVSRLGHRNLHLIEGGDLLTDYSGITKDLIHPGDYSHCEMGSQLAARMREIQDLKQ